MRLARLYPEAARTWIKRSYAMVLVFLAVVIAVTSLPTIALLEYDANKSQNNHHAASVKQDAEIKALVKEDIEKTAEVRNAQKVNKGTLTELQSLATESAALQKEVASVIQGLPAADSELGAFAAYSISVNEAVCADIVKVAASTGITLTACPTVPALAPIK